MKTKTFFFAIILVLSNKVTAQWIEMNPGINETYTTIDCVDATHCFIGGFSQGLVMKTVDGVNWTDISVPASNGVSWIKAFNKDTCYVLSTNSLWKTYDGGNNWIEIPLSVSPRYFINSNVGYTGGAYLYKTNDGGANWSWINTLPSIVDGIYNPFFINEMNGLITVAESNSTKLAIYKTSDGSQNWIKVYEKPRPDNTYNFTDFQMINSTTGFVCGSLGAIYKTSNGGDTWVELDNPYKDSNTVSYNSLDFINESNGYVIGTQGTILKTTDGGNTWINEGAINYGALGEVSIGSLDTAYIASGQLNEVLKNSNVDFTASILENDIEIGKIYPNPTNSVVNVSITEDNCLVELYDISGKLIKSQALNANVNNQIDLLQMESGLYVYKIIKTNTVISNGKLIKN